MSTALIDTPLFPLSTVLYPGGWLPLRIFEVRYLDMIGRAWREGTSFGVLSLSDGTEVQQPAAEGGAAWAQEQFAGLGTLARVRALEQPQAGLLMVRCEGTQRFRLHKRWRVAAGLWMGQIEPLPADLPVPVPEDLAAAAQSLRQVLTEVREQLPAGSASPLPPEPYVDDCAWVAHRWAELLPLQRGFKQQLLETESPLLRLELVADLLDLMRRRPGEARDPAE